MYLQYFAICTQSGGAEFLHLRWSFRQLKRKIYYHYVLNIYLTPHICIFITQLLSSLKKHAAVCPPPPRVLNSPRTEISLLLIHLGDVYRWVAAVAVWLSSVCLWQSNGATVWHHVTLSTCTEQYFWPRASPAPLRYLKLMECFLHVSLLSHGEGKHAAGVWERCVICRKGFS